MTKRGSLHAYRDVDPLELEETCTLDLATRGGMTLEQVASRLNLTRERVRQNELEALEKLRKSGLPPEEILA